MYQALMLLFIGIGVFGLAMITLATVRHLRARTQVWVVRVMASDGEWVTRSLHASYEEGVAEVSALRTLDGHNFNLYSVVRVSP